MFYLFIYVYLLFCFSVDVTPTQVAIGKMHMLLTLLVCIFMAQCRGFGRRAMPDDVYDVIAQCVNGEFCVEVSERTRTKRSALVRYWRNRDRLSINNGFLCIDGKRVMKQSELFDNINKCMEKTKGSGIRKIRHRMGANYHGISDAQVARVLEKSTTYQKVKARFGNRAVMTPIRASNVQIRHQIDLMDIRKNAVRSCGVTYQYILTVIDVFSRYLWMQPLESKRSSEIARRLTAIYIEHGPPRVLQHDRGQEFRGAVEKLMKKLGVKVITSSPYHPQSQGKVERCHRTIRRKIQYDLVQKGNEGVNWAEQIPSYCEILNNDVKEELGYRSPFDVYYGRHNNAVKEGLQGCMANDVRHERHVRCVQLPSQGDINRLEAHRLDMRRLVRQANKRCSDRMIARWKKTNPPSVYAQKERVLVRLKDRKHAKRHFCVDGEIVQRNLNLARYKVRFTSPVTQLTEQKWISVSEITSTTHYREKRHQRQSHRDRYYIPMGPTSELDCLQRHGFQVRLNPEPNGDCQFVAIADQLSQMGVYRSENTLRQEIVRYIVERPCINDGSSISNFVDRCDLESYLDAMSRAGTYGDHITLQICTEIFHIQFIVLSSLGPDATSLISSTGRYDETIPTLYLAHLQEGRGEHYISIEGSAEAETMVNAMFWCDDRKAATGDRDDDARGLRGGDGRSEDERREEEDHREDERREEEEDYREDERIEEEDHREDERREEGDHREDERREEEEDYREDERREEEDHREYERREEEDHREDERREEEDHREDERREEEEDYREDERIEEEDHREDERREEEEDYREDERREEEEDYREDERIEEEDHREDERREEEDHREDERREEEDHREDERREEEDHREDERREEEDHREDERREEEEDYREDERREEEDYREDERREEEEDYREDERREEEDYREDERREEEDHREDERREEEDHSEDERREEEDHSEDERRQEEDHREDDGVVHAAAVDLIDGEDNAVDKYDVPVLPNEIVVHIVRMAIASDIAMLGTINRVSSAFREIATIATNTDGPRLHFSEALSDGGRYTFEYQKADEGSYARKWGRFTRATHICRESTLV